MTENNAHPHISSDDRVVLVHNGIIENARDIRAELEAKGIKFHTETDTESAVQYLGYVYDGDPKEAIVKLTARRAQGLAARRRTRGERGLLRVRPDRAA